MNDFLKMSSDTLLFYILQKIDEAEDLKPFNHWSGANQLVELKLRQGKYLELVRNRLDNYGYALKMTSVDKEVWAAAKEILARYMKELNEAIEELRPEGVTEMRYFVSEGDPSSDLSISASPFYKKPEHAKKHLDMLHKLVEMGSIVMGEKEYVLANREIDLAEICQSFQYNRTCWDIAETIERITK